MPTNTPDQGIPLPQGADPADGPTAFTNNTAAIEQRLVRNYTDATDRTARMVALGENDISTLDAENRIEVFDGANQISLRARSVYAEPFLTADAIPINNSTVLVTDPNLGAALPATGRFLWSLVLFYDSSTTADFKIAFTWPALATVKWGIVAASTAVSSGVGTGAWSTATVSGTSMAIGGSGVGTANTLMATVQGSILMGGTSGVLRLQYAQQVADLTNSVVRADSRMSVWRVA